MITTTNNDYIQYILLMINNRVKVSTSDNTQQYIVFIFTYIDYIEIKHIWNVQLTIDNCVYTRISE